MRYLFVFIVTIAFSCQPKTQAPESKTMLDGLGREVLIPNEIKSIISLSPALTEILYFMCDDSLIAGRTQACDYPPEVFEKPEISTYPFDIEGILALSPDLIVSEDGITSPDQLRLLEQNGLKTYVFRYRDMDDIFLAMEQVGEFCQCDETGNKRIDSLQQAMNTFFQSIEDDSPKVLGLIWTDPIYVYGKNTLFTDQLNRIGALNAIDSVFIKPYPEISREYFLSMNPDVIIGPSVEHLDTTLFKRYPELKRVHAYKTNRIHELDGDILTRPGPRSVEALRLLKKAIYEE